MAWYDSALYALDSLFGRGGPSLDEEEEGYAVDDFDGGPVAEREEAARDPFAMGANQGFQNVLDKADADERQRKIQEDIQRQNQQFQQQNFQQAPIPAPVQARPGQVTGRGPRFGKGSAHQAGLEVRTQRQQGGLEARKQRHKQALAGRGMRAV